MNGARLTIGFLVLILAGCQPDVSSDPPGRESSVTADAASETEGSRLVDLAIERRARGEYLLALEAGHEALRIAETTGNLPLRDERTCRTSAAPRSALFSMFSITARTFGRVSTRLR